MVDKVKVNGKVCHYNDDNHTYTVDGDTIPGVTSITDVIDKSGPLMWWTVNEARDFITENFTDIIDEDNPYDEVAINELADKARTAHQRSSSEGITVGNVVHNYAENYMRSVINDDVEEPDFPDNELAQVSAIEFLDWVENNDVEPIALEQMVFHPFYEYAGTFDLEAIVNGKRLVVDYKTSSGIYDENKMQVTAYLMAQMEHENDIDYDGIAVIRFPKDSTGFEYEQITDDSRIDHHWKGFLGAKELYKWHERN